MSIDTQKLTHELKIKKKILETPDACSFVLDIPTQLESTFTYKPGQFVTLFLTVNNEEIRRSYSLSSSPEVDVDFKITVKRIAGGKGSNLLFDQYKEGDSLRVTPPAGSFYRQPSDTKGRHFVLFAGGSGITPLISILKTSLNQNKLNHVSLVYANQSRESIIFFEELSQLQSSFEDRLQVFHILSQPGGPHSGYTGRVTETTLNEILDKVTKATPDHEAEYYMCGPVGFMTTVESALEKRTVNRSNIHRESFASTPTDLPGYTPASFDEDEHSNRVIIGEATEKNNGQPEKLEVVLNGERHSVTYSGEDSILESLIEAGLNPPYSCMDGNCMACMAKVKVGQIYQEDPGILTEENIECGEILTCQAKPLTKSVTIDYDEI